MDIIKGEPMEWQEWIDGKKNTKELIKFNPKYYRAES